MRDARSVWAGILSVSALLGASMHLVARLAPTGPLRSVPSFDIYSYAYPILILVADAVRHGGRGLFWNPYQECGQPLLGIGMTGALYPGSLVFLVFDPETALRALLAFNVAAGAIGTYLLCRELGISRVAAVCGGLAFGCSNAAVDLISSTPILSGPYAWMPLAVLFCERILKRPTLPRAAGLGIVLTIALMPGHPQVLVFIYQLLALRVLFEMISMRSLLGWRTLGCLALALALPPLLGAVHLIPALETMRLSVRSQPLSINEIESGGALLSWEMIQSQFLVRRELFNPFTVSLVTLASLALTSTALLRQALFYTTMTLVFLDLAMGSNGYLFAYYNDLPLAGLFRAPDRFQWVAAFCVAMLVAISVHTLTGSEARPQGWARRLLQVLLPAAAFASLYFWAPNIGTRAGEPLVVALLLGGVAAAVLVPRLRPLAALVLAAAVFLNVVEYRQVPLRTLLPNGFETMTSLKSTFQLLQNLVTAQDRIHIAARVGDIALQQKTGSLFGVPVLNDYNSLSTLRFAHYFTMMRLGGDMYDLRIFYFVLGGQLPRSINRRLLDLASVRYVVVDESENANATSFRHPPLKLVFQHRVRPGSAADLAAGAPKDANAADGNFVRIYENTTARPRARWVSSVAVEEDSLELLKRLAKGKDDLDRMALVESVPASGFRGSPAPAVGTVTFARNDPEHLVLEVDSREPGFVVVSDQWTSDWHATVDGRPAEILRANYLFRAVEVPAGKSTVEMRYFPRGVVLGLLVSSATAILLTIALVWTRRRRESGSSQG